MQSVGSVWMWAVFFVFVLFVLFVDMIAIKEKQGHAMSIRAASFWTAIWMVCACLFGVGLWWHLLGEYGSQVAQQKTLEFFTGYVVELSLSVDNLFVFLLIFTTFAVPKHCLRRALLYGVFGAMVMRLIFILVGSWVVSHFHWVLYLFGLFLVYTGIKILLVDDDKKDITQHPLLKFLRKKIRITADYVHHYFFVKQNHLWYATPLFLVVVMIEVCDLIFALDSIPAVFSITQDPFIVFTSNIFAIMGLRALYFILEYMASRFYLLKYGIGLVLGFVGVKMLIEPWVSLPIMLSLFTVIATLTTSVVLSLLAPPKE